MYANIPIGTFWAEFCPSDYSASMAEIGQQAGPDTWRAAMDDAEDWPILSDAAALDSFLTQCESSGAWTNEDLQRMTPQEIKALALQWLAGDMRDILQLPFGVRVDPAAVDWDAVQARCEGGQCSGSIFPGDDGMVYWTVGE